MRSAIGKEKCPTLSVFSSMARVSNRQILQIRYAMIPTTLILITIRINPAENLEPRANRELLKLDMQDGDTLEVHQEQIGGC